MVRATAATGIVPVPAAEGRVASMLINLEREDAANQPVNLDDIFAQ